jgi:putative (di)nucleoside polyphosphate hydrolase
VGKYPVDLLSERQWALLLETYIDRQRLMVTNEDMGERRFQVLMTVVGAVGIALGLVAGRFDVASLQATALLMALLLALLGYATLMRVARRDVATSRLKAELLRIREFVASGRPDLAAVLPYMAEKPAGLRARPLYPSGGLVDLVAMVTAAFAGIALGTLLGGRVDNLTTVSGAIGAAALAWLGMAMMVRRVYRSAGILSEGAPTPSDGAERTSPTLDPTVLAPPREAFWACVGVVVEDGDGRVLMVERSEGEGFWEFPQVCLEPGEGRREAALRALHDQTGLTDTNARLERALGRWLIHEVPDDLRSEATGMGRTLWWFLGLVTGDMPGAIENGTANDWFTWSEVASRVPEFERSVYAQLARAFAPPGST